MIDTHQHLLEPSRFHYSWTAGFPALQGTFGVAEYRKAAEGCGITGAVFMEVDVDENESAGEARHFCDLAEDPASGILAVVASGRPEHPGFAAHLDAIAHRRLAGIRRVLHTQPDELSQAARFREGVRELGRRGLTFDLCVLQRQLSLAGDLVRACPETTFVLDHCGVPDIAGNDAPGGPGFRAWSDGVRALAGEPNVYCKISGLTAYAREDQRTRDGLGPYVQTVIEAFGPKRCLWGGDWPVVNLGSGLAGWCRVFADTIAELGAEEKFDLTTRTAAKVYRLQPSTANA